MAMTTEQEILQYEQQLADAKRLLDIDAMERIYADDLLLTGVLGEPTCGKAAVIEEAKRGILQRENAVASGNQFETSARNEDMKVTTHGDAAVTNYRFVVRFTGPNHN